MAHYASMATLLLGSIACVGGIDNDPFRAGTTEVRGVITGPIDPASAWAAIIGRSDLTTTVGGDGRFAISGVPAGTVELASSTGEGLASRQTLRLYATRPLELEVASEPGVTISGRVDLEAPTSIAATLSIEGLPVSIEAQLVGGSFTLAGLPKGALRLSIHHPSHGSFDVDLDSVPGQVHELGGVPLARAFDGPRSACEPCAAPSDCGSGMCMDVDHLGSGERVCVDACAVGGICAQGFDCVDLGGHHGCWPRATTCAGFDAQRRLEPCEGDDSCGLDGADDAICAEHRCAVHCADGADCPDGWSCSGTPSVCTPG